MKSSTRFPGICRHAKSLGVSRTHLYLCLTGERTFAEALRARYERLLVDEVSKIPESELPFPNCFSTNLFSAEKIKEIEIEFGDAAVVRGNVVFFDLTKVGFVHRHKGKRYYGKPCGNTVFVPHPTGNGERRTAP